MIRIPKPRFHASKGLTLVEITSCLVLIGVLSFSVFQGVRHSFAWLNMQVVERQAKSLITVLSIDLELARAQGPVNEITDFFGNNYTQQWPEKKASIARGASQSRVMTDALEVVGDCIVNRGDFRPCFSAATGPWVEFDQQPVIGASAQASVLRVTASHGATLPLDLTPDAKMLQNRYFQQTRLRRRQRLDTEPRLPEQESPPSVPSRGRPQ